MRPTAVAFLTLLGLAACSPPAVVPSDAQPTDGAGMDSARDASAGIDAVQPRDVQPRDVPQPDAQRADGGGWAGCNPETGIECDGDWDGRCSATCAANECCSPQAGRFACVPREASGACPAADLWVDRSRIESNYRIEYSDFAPTSCAVQEACVHGPGRRRLLRFDTWTPNTGGADMYLGMPSRTSSYFEYSECHQHYHFNSYAEYRLLAPDGALASTGHKQAFCLLDLARYDAPSSQSSVYSCGNQGIQRGFQDVYSSGLDCQWIDITDVPPGEYNLHIAINTEHILNESDYSNNEITVPVTIPPGEGPAPDGGVTTDAMTTVDAGPIGTDPVMTCPVAAMGLERECGFTVEGTHTCTPGDPVMVGCSARCMLGSCTGNTVIRVCPGTTPCFHRDALTANDNSGCGGVSCSRGECCSRAQFVCPATGQYTVLWGAFDTSMAASTTCTIDVR